MTEEMRYCRRLIEVDLPIKRISAHARREKSIRHGHISTLHIWWARRPLAACRAVLCASLWPDPADPLCPEEFKITAREEMIDWANKHLTLLSAESFTRFVEFQKDPTLLEDNLLLRKALLDFIADFSNWDNSTVAEYLESSLRLTQVAHESLGGITGTRPMVVDPFTGGGSIPLEALRVGAEAFASDLNPVAVLLNKVVLDYIPRYGQKLADAVREWGDWIKKEAEKELAEFYPQDSDGATPIAYLWARTIQCEGPGCGAEIPLMRSFWLAKKQNQSVSLKIIPNYKDKKVEFEIIKNAKVRDVGDGTVKRGSATCPLCGYTTPVASVRRQLKERHGGTEDARLFCVVTMQKNEQGRLYRLPCEQDLEAVKKAKQELERRKTDHIGDLSLVPDEPTPSNEGHRAVGSPIIYGMDTWGDLFTSRQALAITTLARLIKTLEEKLISKGNMGFEHAVITCLALALDRQVDYLSSLTLWANTGEFIAHTFGRQALPMVWEWPECQPFANGSGNWEGATNWVALVIEKTSNGINRIGQAETASAVNNPLPNDIAQCLFTDPPYYDAVPYADLADYFYVWIKRTIGWLYPQVIQDYLTPKQEQAIVWHPGSIEEKKHYENKMSQALSEGRRYLSPEGIGCIVFAHKSTEGWEAQLQAMVDAGWVITASWPIDTERPGRVNSIGTASLASSIHLICRPLENQYGSLLTDIIGDWRDVLQELPKRIHEWMPRLAENGVVGADAIFACLGPALEVFSRYSSVEKP
ncbi:MAG: DUF1156 domain-containing protein, partial [Syntrophomonadaceae bacterium]|nr:DUF1156 domain-containing protein [Syntrophomonadaceae bacterium]